MNNIPKNGTSSHKIWKIEIKNNVFIGSEESAGLVKIKKYGALNKIKLYSKWLTKSAIIGVLLPKNLEPNQENKFDKGS